MSAAAVGKNDDGVGALKGVRLRRPAIGIDHAGDAAKLVQALLEQETPGPVFVRTGAVAGGWIGVGERTEAWRMGY